MRETATQRKRRLEKARDKYRDNRDNEDRIVKRIRLDAYSQYMRKWRSAETTEQRQQRLQLDQKRHSLQRANESLEEREARLETVRQSIVQHRANESLEEREARLLCDRQQHGMDGIHLIKPKSIQFPAKFSYGTAERRMLPLILLWASTAHKMQGTTVDYAVVYLGRKLFVQSQAYVIISRVRSLDRLRIEELDASKITGKTSCNVDALDEIERMRQHRPNISEEIGNEGQ